MIYLDNAATTALSPYIKSILSDTYSRLYGNNSSPHKIGKESNAALESARVSIAELFGVDSRGIYFTSGATESINLLFQGYTKLLQRNTQPQNEIIISQIEHPAVYQTAHYLKKQGFIVHELKNDNYGRIDTEHLKELLNNKTALVAVMAVNNETGVVQHISDLVDIVKDNNDKTLFFTDTVQALCKIDVTPFTRKVDGFCGSAHKIGGPKGVGFLYLNPKFRALPIIYGGEQELSFRPGTVNVPGIFLMSEALIDRTTHFNVNTKHVTEINTYLEKKLKDYNIEFSRIVPLEQTSPYIVSLSLPIQNDRLLESLSERNICVSKRSACSSQSHSKSRILESMGIEHDEIDRIIRVSFSRETTKEEIDAFAQAVQEIIA